jgi:hypothetical protein
MANNLEEEHILVHYEDSASNGGPLNKEGSTRDPIVRSLFPDTATIDPAVPIAATTTSAPTSFVGIGIADPTVWGVVYPVITNQNLSPSTTCGEVALCCVHGGCFRCARLAF